MWRNERPGAAPRILQGRRRPLLSRYECQALSGPPDRPPLSCVSSGSSTLLSCLKTPGPQGKQIPDCTASLLICSTCCKCEISEGKSQ